MSTATTTTKAKNDRNSAARKPEETKFAEAAKAQVSESVSQAQESLGNAFDQGSEELKRFSQTSEKFVRENPGLALAGAAGLGLLIGLAMRNRY